MKKSFKETIINVGTLCALWYALGVAFREFYTPDKYWQMFWRKRRATHKARHHLNASSLTALEAAAINGWAYANEGEYRNVVYLNKWMRRQRERYGFCGCHAFNQTAA